VSRVLVVGSAALDTVKTPYGEVDDALGGSAFFFSAAASYFCPVRIVAVIGDDFPMEKIEFLKKKDVDMTGLEVTPGKTFRWGGIYHQDMNQRDTLFTDLNVFETFTPKLPPEFRRTPYIFLANIHPALQMQVLDQIEDPKMVLLDTMNLWINTDLEGLKNVMARVDRGVIDLGPKTVVVKKGEHGAFIISEDDYFALPAYPLESVFDPTGAGDSFAGGMIGYLTQQDDSSPLTFRKALVYGTVIASFLVERFSVDRLKDLSQDEIDQRYQRLAEITRFE
jgi:sugar/nucleoside kinase (ribokinase family)